jgi:hypothetical protein
VLVPRARARGGGVERGFSPPAGGKVASRPSRAARRQFGSRRLGASAEQTGVRGASAGGAGAGDSETRCHVRGRRGGKGWFTRSPGDRQAGDPEGGEGGAGQRSGVCDPAGRNFQNHTGHVQQAGRVSPSTPALAGGRSFEEGSNAVLAGRAGHGVRGGEAPSARPRGFQSLGAGAGNASSISHRQWRNCLNAGGESWEAGHGRQAGVHRADYTVPAGKSRAAHPKTLPGRKIDTI